MSARAARFNFGRCGCCRCRTVSWWRSIKALPDPRGWHPDRGRAGGRQAALETLRETRPVGVVADTAAPLEGDGVDGTQRRRVSGEFVEVADDDLLARIDDVQPIESEP